MKVELTHDILAKKVYDRIGADEQMRLKVAQMLRDRYDYYCDTENLMSAQDLAYLDPYLDQVEVTEGEQALIRKSRKAMRMRERRARLIVACLGIILLVAALFSIRFAIQTQDEKENAELAVNNLRSTKSRIVNSIIADAEADIYHVRYRRALENFQSAEEVGLDPEAKSQWIRGMIEIAFFYNESCGKDQSRRDTAFNLVLHLAERTNRRHSLDKSYSGIQTGLMQIDSFWCDSLLRRYYPVLIEVEGGRVQEGEFNGLEVNTFHLAQTETTVWQYALYCADTKSVAIDDFAPGWGLDGDNPVGNISWYDAVGYVNWLSNRRGLDTAYILGGSGIQSILTTTAYRLPKEIEWEYAARGGRNQQNYGHCGSDSLALVGWYDENNGGRTRPVAQLAPVIRETLEIYDMCGNVEEWCEDWLWYYGSGKNNSVRVIRGRGQNYPPGVDNRILSGPNQKWDFSGFRIVKNGGIIGR